MYHNVVLVLVLICELDIYPQQLEIVVMRPGWSSSGNSCYSSRPLQNMSWKVQYMFSSIAADVHLVLRLCGSVRVIVRWF